MRLDTLWGTALVLALMIPPSMGSVECRHAKADYDSALADVREALADYAKCLSSSHGRKTCSKEMDALDDAQDDLEDAVTTYGTMCP
ncbi:MAG TPA: hypothetical protein VFA12_15795 [Stellaceae bacterium]|nr:hypothetical protein [Stellaceae bacterium]